MAEIIDWNPFFMAEITFNHFAKITYFKQNTLRLCNKLPGAVVKAACLESLRLRVRIPLWP